MKRIRIKTDRVVKEVVLNTSETASGIWEVLPIQGTVNVFGKVDGRPEDFGNVEDGEEILVERAED